MERLAAYARSERPGARVHLGPHLEEALELYLEGTEAQRDRGPGGRTLIRDPAAAAPVLLASVIERPPGSG